MRIKVLIILSFLWVIRVDAGLDASLIKGVDELIAPSCQKKISPVYALGMIKSGTLPNIRFFGSYGKIPEGQEMNYPSCHWANPLASDHDDCPLDYTSALIQSLFPSHAGGHLVPNQGSTSDPISQLTPENIGKVIELLQHWNIPEKGESDSQWEDLWTLQVYHALNPNDQKIKQVTFLALSRAHDYCTVNNQSEHQIDQLTRNLEVTFGTLERQKKINLDHTIEDLKGTKRWKAIDLWAKTLYRAVQESKKNQSVYPEFLLERALMSYFLLKEEGKEAILRFLGSVPSCLTEKGKAIVEQFQGLTRARQVASTASVTPELKGFLESHFMPADYYEFLRNPSQQAEQLLHDPERLGYFYYQGSFSYLPPLIGGQEASHKSLGKDPKSERKYHLYSDCGEASVRNFFNIILYHPETKRFNSALLEEMAQKHHLKLFRDVSKKGKLDQVGTEKGLLAFYHRNPDLSNLDSNLARDDWSRRVVSGLAGVSYLRGRNSQGGAPQCEMNAGVDNTLHLIGTLMGDSKIALPGVEDDRSTALDRLCEVVSRDGFKVSWQTQTQHSPNDINEILVFSINGKPSFQWEFMPGHFNLLEIQETSSGKQDWSAALPKQGAQIELDRIWNPIEESEFADSSLSKIWNQKLRNAQVRLDLLEQVPFNVEAGAIAHRFTKNLVLSNERLDRRVASLVAVKTRYAPLIQVLSQKGSKMMTPAHYLAEQGDAVGLQFVVKQVPKILREKDGGGWTPAHYAALKGNLDVLKLITEEAPETLSEMGRGSRDLPVHLAAARSQVHVLKYLAEKFPESFKIKNRMGLSAMDQIQNAQLKAEIQALINQQIE
jgi:hypothetical protein